MRIERNHNESASLRTVLRQIRLQTLDVCGQLQAARSNIARRHGVIVLMLHRIIPDGQMHQCRSPRGMVLRESGFRALLQYLRAETEIIAPTDLPHTHARSGRPQVLVTFDDGWADNYEVAAPYLAAFNIKACFFVVTAYAGCSHPFWPEHVLWLRGLAQQAHRSDLWKGFLESFHVQESNRRHPEIVSGPEEKVLSWLKQFSAAEILERADEALFRLDPTLDRITSDPYERLMTWDEMRSLAKQGHMLASHTCTHPLLTHLGGRAVAEELRNSWLDLNTKIWHDAGSSAWISYPNGDVDSSVQAAAHRAGYRYGFTTVPGVWPGRSESLSIPRVNIWDGSLLSSDGTFNENCLAHTLFWRPNHATWH